MVGTWACNGPRCTLMDNGGENILAEWRTPNKGEEVPIKRQIKLCFFPFVLPILCVHHGNFCSVGYRLPSKWNNLCVEKFLLCRSDPSG
jgi:hypothetical protein